jgi:hypothetical protein
MPFDVQEETVGPHETVLYAPAKPRLIEHRKGISNALEKQNKDFQSGHSVTLQVANFRWIDGVPADTLGKESFALVPLNNDDSSTKNSTTQVPTPSGAATDRIREIFSSNDPLHESQPHENHHSHPLFPHIGSPLQSVTSSKNKNKQDLKHLKVLKLGKSVKSSSSDHNLVKEKDWRLENMKRLVCDTVRSVNGGREVTLRSCFRLRNSTGHVLLVAKKSDPRRGQHASKHINIANYTTAVSSEDRTRNDEKEGAEEELEEGLVEHYETVLPGEDYYVPLAEVTTTSLWLGAYEPSEVIEDADNNTMFHHSTESNQRTTSSTAAQIHHHHHYHHEQGSNNGHHHHHHQQQQGSSKVADKVQMVKSARFAQQPIPLTNLVVESSEVSFKEKEETI